MNVFVQHSRNIIFGTLLAIGLPAVADDFKDLSIYDEVNVESEAAPDPEVANDIVDAIGGDADLPPEERPVPAASASPSDYRFGNATPEPEYDPGMSELANRHAKKKFAKKKLAKTKVKAKKAKAKKRTVARN